ncbi:TetR/AcrR family transcriptional regulator [Actinospica durhamensis]|uniref:TetR/AcrR family transcriptional regulator n=1 Tax=Actinospica durhamensis TaxID=1508375 RepID=A0A941ISP0_9ACTN|nr:TetR/AcrR family transcriptional regulator [Actinospica durhamensis]MBR7833426.1 TetR/AcrR family transcriptional regulator [Actinospica durhamensis]
MDDSPTTEKRVRGRPREARVEGDVFDAVFELVAESGLGAVTMDAVSVRAGVSKPALYRRWPGKQELLLAAAESRLGPLSVPDLGDFRAELRMVLRARLVAYALPGSARLFAGLIAAAAEADEERPAYSAYLARTTAQTREILERGIRRGEVRADLDVGAAVTVIASSLLMRVVIEGLPPDEGFAESVLDLVVRAAT